MVWPKARGCAVVHDKPIFAQHQTIAHAPLFQCRKRVGVYEIKKAGCVRSLNVDFTKRGYVTHADRVAHVLDLAITGLTPSLFAIDREIRRAIPLPGFDHRGTRSDALGMTGGQTFGRKSFALCSGPKCRQCNRSVRRAKSGCSGFWNPASGCIRQHSQGRHIRILALIGRHSLCRVAFHVLDRGEIFYRGLFDILDAHIVLKIKPRASPTRHSPKRLKRVGRMIRLRQFVFSTGNAQRFKTVMRGFGPFGQTLGSGKRPIASPGRQQAGNGPRGRNKAGDLRAPRRPSVHMTSQMNGWVPSTRHGQTICGDPFCSARRLDRNRLEPPTSLRARHHGTRIELVVTQRFCILATVYNTRDMHARSLQVDRGPVRIIIVGKNGDRFARRNTPAVQIGPHRARRHNSGPVIVLERDVTLECASCQHRPPRDNPPKGFLDPAPGHRFDMM